MAMSRKHYREVAQVLRSAFDAVRVEIDGEAIEGVWEREPYEALERVTRELADVFKRDNSAFSYQVFYEACGVKVSVHAGRR